MKRFVVFVIAALGLPMSTVPAGGPKVLKFGGKKLAKGKEITVTAGGKVLAKTKVPKRC